MAAGCALAAPSAALAQTTPTCAPTELVADGTDARWEPAVEAVRRALASEGRAWSCRGGRVVVSFAPGPRAVVVAEVPGEAPATRTVRAPSELAATVEGLLIVVSAAETCPVPPATVAPSPAPRPSPAAQPVTPSTPVPRTATPGRFLAVVFADAGLRFEGARPTLSGTARFGAGFGVRWVRLELWARLDTFDATLADGQPPGLGTDVLVVGAGAVGVIPLGQGALEAGLGFSVAEVNEATGTTYEQHEDALGQTRVGALLRWRSREAGLGFTAALDADVAVGVLAQGAAGWDPALPPPTTWSAALSAGVAWGSAL